MEWVRREFLKLAGAATLVAPAMLARGARSAIAQVPAAAAGTVFDVRGATGHGKTIDSPAINLAIEAAGAQGGGTVYVPAGTYACYSLRLTSAVAIYLDQGATILAADTPRDGTASGYDPAVGVRLPWRVIHALDKWGKKQGFGSRSEAIRHLVQIGLAHSADIEGQATNESPAQGRGSCHVANAPMSMNGRGTILPQPVEAINARRAACPHPAKADIRMPNR